jgi:hypothetical protein
MELIQSKSLLAKLMANENLTIEQRNTNTAAFDVKNRVLTVPVLDKNISGYLYDLFLGHEVGHALYTPLDGMMKAHEEKIPMGIMNVLEDCRIEKKIKNKYPGIRSSFVRGYRELIEKDFFGTNGTDLNDMNFIDRVNLYTKGGAAQSIRFTDIEKSLVHRIENTETYDDVIALAYDVMAYMKEEAEKRKANAPEEFEEDPDGEFESEGYEDSDDYDDADDTIEKYGQPNSEADESMDESEEKRIQEMFGQEGGDVVGEQLDSQTDKSYRKNESKLFESNNRHYYYGNINDIDLKQAVVPYKELWTDYKNDMGKYGVGSGIDTTAFMKIRNDAKKVVGYLAKEFELRKNADQQKRASIAKTGELNLNKVYAYKFTEDIFKKMTVLPDGKSHGLVMFLDWSGSMSDHMENTIKQLINLVMFCKKVNIPYEVYAFTSEHKDAYHVKFKAGDLDLHKFKLMNLLSSKMSASEFTYACSALVHSAQPRACRPFWMQLGGTPLYEGVIAAMKIIPEFQKNYKLQIVNTVFLTDGEGNPVRNVYYTSDDGRTGSGYNNPELDYNSSYGKEKVLVIRDPITKHEEKVYQPYGPELMSAYIKMLKARTQCNVIGFYVLSGREFGRVAHTFYPRVSDHYKLKSEFRKEKYKIVTNVGFDEYYLLRSEGLDTDDDVEFVVKQNATTRGLVSAFSKYAGNRLSNRVVLNRFIGMIA